MEDWSNGQDLLLTESESLSDSSESESEVSSELSSGTELTVTQELNYSTGHFSSMNDFVTVGFVGIEIGFGFSVALGLVTLAFNALLNILKKGGK